MATVRYIVNDVDASLAFYREHLAFREVMHPAPQFALLVRGDLRLAIVSPVDAGHPGGAGAPPPSPGPGPAARSGSSRLARARSRQAGRHRRRPGRAR